MDYLTKKCTRSELRKYAKAFRVLFELDIEEKIDPVMILELMPLKIPNVFFSVVENRDLPYGIPAVTVIREDATLEIQIKNGVYSAARNNDGASRDHIIHECSHVFLYKLGYTPVLARTFRNNELPYYKSAEWQAKALCGEIMIPYEYAKGKSQQEIAMDYGVSDMQANYFINKVSKT